MRGEGKKKKLQEQEKGERSEVKKISESKGEREKKSLADSCVMSTFNMDTRFCICAGAFFILSLSLLTF